MQLVDLADVYDERGFGDKSADAVRDFIQAARATWRVPPRFVLLVGDATFDPRNFLGLGDFDFAPTRLIDTATMETASDDWFVDADLDGVPELAIGRMAGAHRRPGRGAGGQDAGLGRDRRTSAAGLCSSATRTSPDLDFHGCRAPRPRPRSSGRMPVDLFRRSDPGRDRSGAGRQAQRRPVPRELPRAWFGGGVGRPAGRAPQAGGAQQRTPVDLRGHELPQRILSRPLHDQSGRDPAGGAGRRRRGVGFVHAGRFRSTTDV